MKNKKILLGIIMMILPFLGVFIWSILLLGTEALLGWGAIALLGFWIFVAGYLLEKGENQ